jgi:hypothetical protein
MIGRVAALVAFAGLAVTAVIRPAAAAPSQQPPPPSPPHRILIVGDSTAETIYPFLRDAAAAHGIDVESAARIGCSVIDGVPKLDDGSPYVDIYGDTSQCAGITSAQQNRVLATENPDVVIWLSEWESWPNRVLDGQLVHFGTIPGNKAILAHIDAAVSRLTARGARLVMMPSAPRAAPSVRGLANPTGNARIVQLAKLLRTYASQHSDKVSLIDLPTILGCATSDQCPEEVAPGIKPRDLDGFHYDGDGATWLANQITGILLGSTPRPTPPVTPACETASPGRGSATSRVAKCA